MSLHSAMRKVFNPHVEGKIMNCTLGDKGREFAIMVKNPLTGNDCIYSGKYLESNILPATGRNDIKGYISQQRAERDIATIFFKGQNARVVTMEAAEIFLVTNYKM